MSERHLPGGADAARMLLTRARRALRQALRLVAALEGDQRRAEDAGQLQQGAEVLKTMLRAWPAAPGAATVTVVVPWSDGEAITLPLQRDLSPAANVERLFRRARGLRAGQAEIARRLGVAQQRRDRLAALIAALTAPPPEVAAPPPEDRTWPALRAEAAALGVLVADLGPPGRPVPPAQGSAARGLRGQPVPSAAGDLEAAVQPWAARRPVALPAQVQRFYGLGGQELLIGRSAQGNDALVTRLSRGDDVWLHVRDRTGAHGLLRCGQGRAPSPDELGEAAALVAWLSGSGRDDSAEVDWTEARHVRKTKGLPAGAVYVQRARTLRVVVRQEVIDALYARRTAVEAAQQAHAARVAARARARAAARPGATAPDSRGS